MKHALRQILVLSLLISYSCNDVDPFDIDDVNFGDPEVGVPLVNSIFYISDIGVNPDNNTDVISDSEGRVTMRYRNGFNPVTMAEVFPRVEDEQVTIVGNSQPFALPFHNIDIRYGDLKDTRVHFEMRNPTNQTVTVILSIPDLKNLVTNVPFLKSYTIAANEDFRSPEEDLSNYVVDTPDGVLELSYNASNQNNIPVVLSEVKIDFVQLNFSYLEGIFDEATLPSIEHLIDISFFDSWVSGGLDLADPKLTFEIDNSIGVPAELTLNSASITTIDDNTFEFESDVLNTGVALNYPTIDNIDGTETTLVQIHADNSNVEDLFSKKPQAIDYDLDLKINSNQNIIGFFTDESSLDIDATVELPLNLKANNLILQDSIGFEEIAFDDVAGTAELLISLRNAFPISVGVNLYFLDDSGETLFTLQEADEWITVDANTNQELTVEELEAQIINIPIAEEDVLHIPSVSNVLLRVLITTTDSFADEYVWVYDHHGIEVKLGAVIK